SSTASTAASASMYACSSFAKVEPAAPSKTQGSIVRLRGRYGCKGSPGAPLPFSRRIVMRPFIVGMFHRPLVRLLLPPQRVAYSLLALLIPLLLRRQLCRLLRVDLAQFRRQRQRVFKDADFPGLPGRCHLHVDRLLEDAHESSI